MDSGTLQVMGDALTGAISTTTLDKATLSLSDTRS